MVCFYLNSCSRQGSLENGRQTCHASNCTFQSILYSPNSGFGIFWGQFWYINPEIRGYVAEWRLLDVIQVMSDNVSSIIHICRRFVKECSRNPWIFEVLVILENVITKILNLWHPQNVRTLKIVCIWYILATGFIYLQLKPACLSNGLICMRLHQPHPASKLKHSILLLNYSCFKWLLQWRNGLYSTGLLLLG